MTADLSDAALRTQCDELDARLTQAAHGGAARCAPEAFGVAQANREFARMELVAGNRQRAKQHLDVAATALAQSTPCR